MASTRLYYLDNLRILLTILVVMFHLAITYGFVGGWYFYDQERTDFFTTILLTYFILVNQAFFMSLFFAISGYFTPASYDRKGPVSFLTDRVIRLGIPLLLFFVLVDPVLSYVYNDNTHVPFLNYLYTAFTTDPVGLIARSAPGPTWFLEALLIFSVVYVFLRVLHMLKKPNTLLANFPSNRSILTFVIVLSLFAFTIRIWYPVGKQFLYLQLGHFAPYIAFFTLGIIAYRSGWLVQLKDDQVKTWFRISIISIILLPVLLYFGGVFDGNFELLIGGFTWQSLVYCLWENFLCVGISLWLLRIFQKKVNQHNNFSTFMADQAYAVYFLHALIAVYFSYFIQPFQVHSFVKFIIASVVVIALCFIAAYVLRKLPLAKRVW